MITGSDTAMPRTVNAEVVDHDNPLMRGNPTLLLQAVLGFVLVMQGVIVKVGGQIFPLSEAAAVALCILAITQRPQRRLSRFGVLGILAVALIAFLIGVSLINDVDWMRRAGRIAILMTLVGSFGSGRLQLKAVLQGLTVALALNIPMFYLGFLPDTYGGVLTGFLGDKNVAGLYYGVVPLLLSATINRRDVKGLLVAFAFLGTVLSGSRSTMAALGCAIIWLLITSKRGIAFRAALLGAMIYGVHYLETNFPRAIFFEDRLGSDHLRSQIDAASWVKVTQTPWYGKGLNEAYVFVDTNRWWYHNSYFAAWTEGGWVFAGVVVAAVVLLGLRPFSNLERTPSRIAVEASTIVLLVCASKLGEVFISIPSMLLLSAGFMLTAEELERHRQLKYEARVARLEELSGRRPRSEISL